jgi:hypothetical protein
MAQTRRKRQTKHRGNAAGVIEARGRTGRPPSADEKKQIDKARTREARLNRRPTIRSSGKRAALAGVFMFMFLILTQHPKHGSPVVSALLLAVVAMALYVFGGYWLDMQLYKRRMAKKEAAAKQ